MNDLVFSNSFSEHFSKLNSESDDFVPELVSLALKEARAHRASDVHFVPAEDRLMMNWRVDGVLHTVAGFGSELSPRVVARLKVLAGLLTYRTDLPQEGRVADNACRELGGEVRISTFPTLYGEKAAVRLFADTSQLQSLDDLRLPEDVQDSLSTMLGHTSGVILLTGPSGSGKTTTAYACLREIVAENQRARGVMTLEDPIEVVVPGVTQSQVRLAAGFDLATGLKSMMRQDPDVIFVGEVRDPETAESAFQAALTGHLVITTFHAGSSVEAITRLLDLGIEPYLIRSTLRSIICQRLLRQSCSECASALPGEAKKTNSENTSDSLDKTAIEDALSKCARCGGVGYHGRFVTAEMLDPNLPGLAKAILERAAARDLQSIANAGGAVTLSERLDRLVEIGSTTREEVFRVLGS